jgi:hypothetical protein
MKSFSDTTPRASLPVLNDSSKSRISDAECANSKGKMALADPDLAEHYARVAAALPALEAQRALEDAEIESATKPSGSETVGHLPQV